MLELYDKYKDKGFEIVGVTNDTKENEWKKAIAEDNTNWIHVIDEFPVKFKPARVISMYGVHYIPSYFLIDPDGKIVGKLDKKALKEELERRLK